MTFKAKNQNINYIIPPGGVTVTFHVPSKCRNNCPFCIVNNNYYSDCSNFDKLKLLNLADTIDVSSVGSFVISGGEPLDCFKFTIDLARQLKNLDKIKPVYINTQLPIEELVRFDGAINDELSRTLQRNVDCISISRHAATQAEEQFDVEGVPDYFIKKYAEKVPIRINCVLNDHSDIAGIVNRWKDSNVTVSFRRDYRYVNVEDLHLRFVNDYMKPFYDAGFTGFIDTKEDNVHDYKALIYKEPTKAKFQFYARLGNTCLIHTFDGVDYYELHDVVVLPDGRIFDDWDIQHAHELEVI